MLREIVPLEHGFLPSWDCVPSSNNQRHSLSHDSFVYEPLHIVNVLAVYAFGVLEWATIKNVLEVFHCGVRGAVLSCEQKKTHEPTIIWNLILC